MCADFARVSRKHAGFPDSDNEPAYLSVSLVAVFHCCLLAYHFRSEFMEQPSLQRDVDSDYDSDDNASGRVNV
ncbi:hypothetical protein PENTCL1PPCAC_19326 [Pristionchus entomophagus]|uniref:Uncharacterized protein n=1 Tax=Pristionchus entomophagus TaxID=358040 RepID=A0AAV5TS75_9BILA|nr:hypothetical protein PENTCL1PPCAC_19326 [Pristionchus entomophagus]